jgi:hypothetical protein
VNIWATAAPIVRTPNRSQSTSFVRRRWYGKARAEEAPTTRRK